MIVSIEGEIIRIGETKKGKRFANVLVRRPDGMKEVVMVIMNGNKDLKIGQIYKGNVNVFGSVCSEAT